VNRLRAAICAGIFIAVAIALPQGEQSSSPSAPGEPGAQIATPQSVRGVPALVPFSGVLVNRSGRPITGSAAITLAIYAEPEGGAPLWSEVQIVQTDQRGNYRAVLGATSVNGLPTELFASSQARWLGVWPAGEDELPRTLILSVPYALKAGDADTLGGKPASAFMAAPESHTGAAISSTGGAPSAAAVGGPPAGAGPTAATYTATANPGPGFISQATSGPPLQVSSSAAVANLNADLLDGFHAAAFAMLATANTFAGTQTIATGNLDLDASTATTGNITKNGARFLHTFGTNNTFLGVNAGSLAMTGANNTASGFGALGSNTAGSNNTALGLGALGSNTTGGNNTASGVSALRDNSEGLDNAAFGLQALRLNTAGSGNTASGINALFNNTIGSRNTAVGASAASNNTTGTNNVAVGWNAGANATTGSNNIYLGANVSGVAGESDTMYLGGSQTKTVIAGVRGTSVTGGEMVVIDVSGRLGSGVVAPAANTVGTNEVIDESLTADDLAPNSVATSELAAASVTADKVAFNYAASSSEGGPASDLACVGCVAASEVSFSFASLGANTFTGTQTLDTGNLDLDPSTATTGNVTKNGTLFLHNFGTNNTFLGLNAGNTSMTGFGNNTAIGRAAFSSNRTGDSNTAVGYQALNSTTDGNLNTAVGASALLRNTTGGGNTASGNFAMIFNTTGASNTASGYLALSNNNTGSQNTAIGQSALSGNIVGDGNTALGLAALQKNTGSNNVGIGRVAGRDGTTGSYNIYIGADILGVAGESNTIYLGREGTQTKTFIAGIRGTTIIGGEPVVIDANGRLGSGAVSPGSNTVGTNEVIDESLTASDLAANSVTASELALDSVTADKVAFNYAASTSEGGPATDVACVGCVAATEVSFSFASLGANTFTATQTIDGGNLDLDASSATGGNITKNGTRFLHNSGPNNTSFNTFLGENAGNFTVTGFGNTAMGVAALNSNTTGNGNSAVGVGALSNNTSGAENTATGWQALSNNTTGTLNTASGIVALQANISGSLNTAVGGVALLSNTSGNRNTAIGSYALYYNVSSGNTAVGAEALFANTTGGQNVAVGEGAGINASTGSNSVYIGRYAGVNSTTGSNNIYLGAFIDGVSGESNTMYLGKQGTQTKTFIAGIRGSTTVNADAIPVMIDSAGQLGTVSSSRRFKEDIHDMADTSRRLFQLRPVTFRYKQAYGDGSKPIQYGLVAEEVAAVLPELAVRNAEGLVETVHYEKLSVLLLNELQKQERRIDALEQRLNELLAPTEARAVANVR